MSFESNFTPLADAKRPTWKMSIMLDSSDRTQRRRCRRNSPQVSGQWVELWQLSAYSSFHPFCIISVHSHRSSPTSRQ